MVYDETVGREVKRQVLEYEVGQHGAHPFPQLNPLPVSPVRQRDGADLHAERAAIIPENSGEAKAKK